MPKLEDLVAWEEELLAEQERLASELEPLLGQRDQVRTKLELIQRLKSLEQNGAPQAVDSRESHVKSVNELQSAVHAILEEHGKPMHISEIRVALLARGVPIPGRGTDANIIVHLRRAKDMFTRQGRGTYALNGQGSARD